MSIEITVIIADDHPIFLNGLKQIIAEDENIKIIGEAGEGEKALQLINEINPEIAILDFDMPKKNGLEILKEVTHNKSETKIIFLTMYKEEDMFNEAMDNGLMGYVLKENAADDIVECINTVSKNCHYISPLISDHLINWRIRINGLVKKSPKLTDLTAMERKILRLVADNKTNKEISEELFISHRTVENHRNEISKKLNLKGSHSLLKFAIENKSFL
jgi:DNA-binding NarL/FixJ family response regulator